MILPPLVFPALSITINCDTHHNDIQHDGSVVMLSVVLLCTIMLNATYKPFMLSVVAPIFLSPVVLPKEPRQV